MKALWILVVAAMFIGSVLCMAADTNTVFSWQRPDQSGMLTISNLTLAGEVTLPSGAGATNATAVTTITPKTNSSVTATGTVSLVYHYITVTNVYDGTTNIFLAPTNLPTATVNINVLNGSGLLTNATAATTVTLELK